MNNLRPVARYCLCVSAALACTAAVAMCAPQQDGWDYFGSQDSKASYLDCARIASGQGVAEPDLVTPCSVVARASHLHDAQG
jgi:hypothetical protein